MCACVKQKERDRAREREGERELHAARGHQASSKVWETWSHLTQAVPLPRRTLRDRAPVGVDARDIGGRDLERHARGQRDVHCLDGETRFGVHIARGDAFWCACRTHLCVDGPGDEFWCTYRKRRRAVVCISDKETFLGVRNEQDLSFSFSGGGKIGGEGGPRVWGGCTGGWTERVGRVCREGGPQECAERVGSISHEMCFNLKDLWQ